MEFENAITNCSHNIVLSEIIDVPPGERYLDSILVSIEHFKVIAHAANKIAIFLYFLQPIVSKELILNCESVSRKMQSKFGKSSRYPHEIIKAGKHEIFEMLTSNVSSTVQLLDEIRRDPKYVYLVLHI